MNFSAFWHAKLIYKSYWRMLYELYRSFEVEHKAKFTIQLISGTFSGSPLPLRSIYGGIAPPPRSPTTTPLDGGNI